MSKQGKKGGGKRQREQKAPPHEESSLPGLDPSESSPQPSPAYSSAGFSDVYQPSLHRSGALGPQVSQSSMHSSQPSPLIGKVAIPALRTPQTSDSKSFRKGRTQHACDACRKAKSGCSGGNPCLRCKTMKSSCVYGDGKREKERKELTKLNQETTHLVQQNTEVMQNLRRIRDDHQLSRDGMRAAIGEVISRNASPNIGFDSPGPSMRHQSSELDDNGDSGEQDADADVGSTGSLDVVTLDTDRSETRGIGHLGKSSAVAWQHRTEEAVSLDPTFLGDKRQSAVTLSSYHTEDADMEHFDTSAVNMYAWPSPQLAGALVESYFTHVHDVFPILNKKEFLSRYHTFPRNSGHLSTEDIIWLGILNAVFAIASTHGRLTATPNLGNTNEHRLYCARATMIFSNQEIFLQDSRIASTCGLALLALYYLSNNRLNRAWTLAGLAVRHALALGLHVRSTANSLSDADKEHRVRLWWSLYSLECTLNELTGRPSCIADRDISTPMPINVEEADFRTNPTLYDRMEGVQSDPLSDSGGSHQRGSHSSRFSPAATYQMPAGFTQPIALAFPPVPPPLTSSTFFIYRTQLSIVSHEIITELYCAATSKVKWLDVENTIRRIDERLLKWSSTLPSEFDVNFDTYSKPDFSQNTLYRTGLAMLFNSSRMILFRPCLCRFEGRIHHQSERSKHFNDESVKKCVHSARRTITLLAWFASSPARFYAIPPFWNTLHCLCEALSVLMLEMAFKSQHLPDETAEILEDAKKGVRWLIMMSEQSIGARKAWEIFDRLIRMVAPIIRWSLYDLPAQAPIPPGYNYLKFDAASSSYQPNPLTQPHSTYLSASATSSSHLQQSFTPSQYSLTPNPLDSAAAMERFFSMGQLHGQYDDPWQHHFHFPDAEQDSVVEGGGGSGPGPMLVPGQPLMQTMGGSEMDMGTTPERRGGFADPGGYGSQGYGEVGPSGAGSYGSGQGGGGF